MTSAFVRLGLISVGSLIVIVFAVFFVRTMGFQQGFASPPHPWFDQSYWTVYEPTEICSEFRQPAPEAMILVRVKFAEGDWFVDCKDSLTLDKMLKTSAHPNWIIHVKTNDSGNLDKLVEIVGSHDFKKKFAFASNSQRASRFLRKKGPQWLFAADHASLLRMQVFTSLWIETAMDFWPDFVIAGSDITQSSYLSERLARELGRRHKRIVWQGNENPLIAIQGRVTANP
jgi:hypothetical protein